MAFEISSPEKTHQLAQSPYWKRLLHYRKNLWGKEKSEADGQGFFLSPNGSTDPEAELFADLAAFANPQAPAIGPLGQHPQCAFPERFHFLKTELALDIQAQACSDFFAWKNRFHVQSVTLVYAAAYFGRPSSMFGHTFLRIDSAPREAQNPKNDLLDYGISFEADMGANPGLMYPLKGLLGLFPGRYSQMPYFLKINSYVNMESRDLWEYQLNLTSEQLDRLLSHIWEMDMTHFNYYFFNRNCSYQLLTLLEVANPEWNLKNQFGGMAIPVDTIRAILEQKNALQAVHYRPSLLHIVEARLAQLTPAELERFYRLRDNVRLANDADSARVLDALMDWQKYQAMQASFSAEEADQHIDSNLLYLRARHPGSINDSFTWPKEAEPTRPDLGHASSLVSLSTGTEANLGYWGFELRPGFHDLLDPDQGFLPDSELNIGRLRASVLSDGSGTTRLDDFVLGEVISYQPMTRLQKPLSWQLSGELTRPVDTGCVACVAEEIQGGAGFTLGTTRASLSVLATGHAELSNAYTSIFAQNYRAGPGGLLLGLWQVSEKIKLLASIEHIRYFPGPDQHYLSKAEVAASYSLRPFELRFAADSYASPWQDIGVLAASLGYYF